MVVGCQRRAPSPTMLPPSENPQPHWPRSGYRPQPAAVPEGSAGYRLPAADRGSHLDRVGKEALPGENLGSLARAPGRQRYKLAGAPRRRARRPRRVDGASRRRFSSSSKKRARRTRRGSTSRCRSACSPSISRACRGSVLDRRSSARNS
jgi:hypothetical protein